MARHKKHKQAGFPSPIKTGKTAKSTGSKLPMLAIASSLALLPAFIPAQAMAADDFIMAGGGGGGAGSGGGGGYGGGGYDIPGSSSIYGGRGGNTYYDPGDSRLITGSGGGGSYIGDGSNAPAGDGDTGKSGPVGGSSGAGYGGNGVNVFGQGDAENGENGRDSRGGKGGSAILNYNGILDADTVQLLAGSGGQSELEGIAGDGGDVILNINGALNAANNIILTAGDGGTLENNQFSDMRSGKGGDVTLNITGNLNAFNDITVTAGDGGLVWNHDRTDGRAEDGGNVNLTVTGTLTTAGTFRADSGRDGYSNNSHPNPGKSGHVNITIGTLVAQEAYFYPTDGNIDLSIGNFHVETAGFDRSWFSGNGALTASISNIDLSQGPYSSSSLTFTDTVTSDINIDRFTFRESTTLNIDVTSGDFTFGGAIDVLGKGNTFNRTGSTVYGVNSLYFLIPSDISTGETMLDANGGLILNNPSLTLGLTGKLTNLQPDPQYINLIENVDSNSRFKDGNYSVWGGGASLNEFEVWLNEDAGQFDLRARYRGEKDVSIVYAKGYMSGIVSLNDSGDFIVDQAISKAGQSIETEEGPGVFAAIGFSHTSTKTGSYIDHDGFTFLAGPAYKLKNPYGSLTLGAFLEGGIGDYDSYNSFEGRDYKSSGDTWHYGIGGLMRQDFSNNSYLEGSLRFGQVKTDFMTSDMGTGAEYKSKSLYWGAHLGLGHELKLDNVNSLDGYAKLLWTRQDSDNTTTDAGERLHFASIDSLRSRLGMRYNHELEKKMKVYAGAAWEYEWDGSLSMKNNGRHIYEPELKGHTGLAELGIEWEATKNWKMNFHGNGLIGRRQGVSFMFFTAYNFE